MICHRGPCHRVAVLLRSLFRIPLTGLRRRATRGSLRLLVVVEGPNDIEFLRRISAMLHAADASVPDLASMEQRNELAFVPFGGGDPLTWSFRLAGLALPEFHIYDRDIGSETVKRRQAAEIVNCRSNCRAVVTRMRTLENYLHSDAVFECSGLRIEFGDDDAVADMVARAAVRQHDTEVTWESLSARSRKKRREKAKSWLNTHAVNRMTAARLAERDPNGDIRAWLQIIANLARCGLP
jgi:hypothetical protein